MPYRGSPTFPRASSPVTEQRQQEKPQYSLVNSLLQLSKSEVNYFDCRNSPKHYWKAILHEQAGENLETNTTCVSNRGPKNFEGQYKQGKKPIKQARKQATKIKC